MFCYGRQNLLQIQSINIKQFVWKCGLNRGGGTAIWGYKKKWTYVGHRRWNTLKMCTLSTGLYTAFASLWYHVNQPFSQPYGHILSVWITFVLGYLQSIWHVRHSSGYPYVVHCYILSYVDCVKKLRPNPERGTSLPIKVQHLRKV